MQMTLIFYLTPIRIAEIKTSRDSTHIPLENILPLMVGMQTCTTILESNLMVSQKTGNSFTSRPSYPTSKQQGCPK